MKLRSVCYARRLIRCHQLEVPVISVGNLTMGGTGKTPVVAHLAAFLQDLGYRPAIISRGYGGTAGNRVNVVSDGTTLFLDARQAGDEPRFLAETLPGIPVLTGIVRILPCRHAVQALGCDLLLLDDGFQHLSVRRDIDMVLFSAETLAGNSRVFPAGDLREPVSALHRAHLFLLTGTTQTNRERAERFSALLQHRFPGKPVFFSSYTPLGARHEPEGAVVPLADLPTPLHGFCGIANPESFRQSLIGQGVTLAGFTSLADHQRYTPRMAQHIEDQAVTYGARALITTAKDVVKLKETHFRLPLFSLHMQTRIDEGLHTFVLQKLQSLRSSSNQ